MKIPINLASQTYENLRPLYIAVVTSAIVLVGLASLVVWKDRQNRNETQLLTAEIHRFQQEVVAMQEEQQELERALQSPEVQQIRDRLAFLNSLILRKSLSWTQIFMDLEKILPSQARIIAISPSPNPFQQAELNLTVAAVEIGPLVEFLKNLESSPQFGSPVVGSQRFPAERAADRSIVLELSTRYFPPNPGMGSSGQSTEVPPKIVEAAALRETPQSSRKE
ncbi:MAG: hypothetical protein HY647_00955 [Acidobacteria bacterium]|nr:hypothetical protein [Acidobacteriota bacterium]